MIVLDLECANAHQFEGWFASSEAFEQQSTNKMVCCPICGTLEVHRRPSAPHVARSTTNETPAEEAPAQANGTLDKLIETLREQAATSEDVGERFPEEARKIHYGDAEDRAIRGHASVSEAMGLLDEGINILPVPPSKEDLH